MERVFQIVAVILAGVAAYFFWTGNKDAAFVSLVFGCVSFFLSIRWQVKERREQREQEQSLEQEQKSAADDAESRGNQ